MSGHNQPARAARASPASARLLVPFLAGVALPVALFLVPYARSGALGAFVYGVFVLPMKRFGVASYPALPLATMLALAPFAVLVVWGASQRNRHWASRDDGPRNRPRTRVGRERRVQRSLSHHLVCGAQLAAGTRDQRACSSWRAHVKRMRARPCLREQDHAAAHRHRPLQPRQFPLLTAPIYFLLLVAPLVSSLLGCVALVRPGASAGAHVADTVRPRPSPRSPCFALPAVR